MRTVLFSVMVLLLWNVFTVGAQDAATTLPEPQRVELAAEDGLVLVGDYYAVPDASDELPAVLLFHMANGNRFEWNSFIPVLLDGGYNALAVDLRGFGETLGARDMMKAQTDTQVWLDWLREQPSVQDDSVAIIGASIGTGLALMGCAADETCTTAIALSPMDLPVGLEAAMSGECSVLLVASQDDYGSMKTTKKLVEAASGEVAAYLFPGGTHGTGYINPHSQSREMMTDLILNWLDLHMPQPEAANSP